MNEQNKTIIIRVDGELKDSFKTKANESHMNISSRIKYLMKLDVDGKLNIKL